MAVMIPIFSLPDPELKEVEDTKYNFAFVFPDNSYANFGEVILSKDKRFEITTPKPVKGTVLKIDGSRELAESMKTDFKGFLNKFYGGFLPFKEENDAYILTPEEPTSYIHVINHYSDNPNIRARVEIPDPEQQGVKILKEYKDIESVGSVHVLLVELPYSKTVYYITNDPDGDEEEWNVKSVSMDVAEDYYFVPKVEAIKRGLSYDDALRLAKCLAGISEEEKPKKREVVMLI